MSSLLTRRGFMRLSLAAASATALASRLPAKSRPNIVFILADDMGINDPSCYGQTKIHTPHIDALAKEGLLFQHAYAGAPICAPSRSTLMTGLHTGHTRVRGNFALDAGSIGYKKKQKIRRAYLLPEDKTVADHLRAAGYRTGLMGKWHLDGYNPGATPMDRGFDEFRGWLTQNESTQGYYPEKRYRNRELIDIPENQGGKEGKYETTMCTEDACDFVRRNAKNPFFLYLAYSAPHSPYTSPTLGTYKDEKWTVDEKTYAAMIEGLDNGIGDLMKTLKEQGLEKNTVVFFASDNGPRSEPTPQQTEVVNFFDSNGVFRGYKRDLYEGGIHDPLIVRWPGHVRPGSTTDTPAYFPDFLPTALSLAGAPSQKTDGVSLVPELYGRKISAERFLYWETYEPEFRQAVRWGKWKGVRLHHGGALELYDLSIDPSEEKDVAKANPEVVAKFEEYLKTAHVDSPEYSLDKLSSIPRTNLTL